MNVGDRNLDAGTSHQSSTALSKSPVAHGNNDVIVASALRGCQWISFDQLPNGKKSESADALWRPPSGRSPRSPSEPDWPAVRAGAALLLGT